MAATARIELRVEPTMKAQLEQAARYDQTSVSAFVISAVEQRLEEVLRRHTSVPANFFDALMAELDESAQPNDAVVRAVRRSRSRSAKA